MKIQRPPQAPPPPDPSALLKEKKILAFETQSDQVTLYGRDGKQLNEGAPAGKDKLFNRLFLPSNYPDSASPDYVASRRWYFARDVATSVTSYLGMSAALNAVGIGNGPLSVGLAWMSRDAFTGLGKFAGGAVAGKAADADPKGWTVKGEYIENAGYLMESALAVWPSAFLALAPSAQIVKAIGSTAKGAAQAPIEQHQARANNLAEIRAKNGNQDLVSSAIGGALAFGVDKLGQAVLGQASTPVLMAAATAAKLFFTHQYARSLDLDPINQKVVIAGVRRWLDAPGGKKSFDKLELGCNLERVTQNPERFQELTSLYAGKNYILEAQGERTFVLLRQESRPEDQLTAVFQAALVQRLRDGSGYKEMLAQQGQEAADRWLVETSLRAMPAEVKPLVSTEDDPIRLQANAPRAQWLDGEPKPLQPLALDELRKLL